jgi:hypothetical protein
MAVAPTMMRAASAAAPSMVARVSDSGSVAAAGTAAPTSSQYAHGEVIGGQGSFGQSFNFDMMSPGGRRAAAEGWFVPPEPPRQGRMDGALFTTSSEIFSALFTPHPQYPLNPGLPGGTATKAGIQHSVETYELTSAVIHNELAARGEQLTVTA